MITYANAMLMHAEVVSLMYTSDVLMCTYDILMARFDALVYGYYNECTRTVQKLLYIYIYIQYMINIMYINV